MINEKRLLDTFIGYAMIDSETKNEKAMGEKLVEDLKALGLEVKTDKAGEGFGSNGFNVCAYLSLIHIWTGIFRRGFTRRDRK